MTWYLVKMRERVLKAIHISSAHVNISSMLLITQFLLWSDNSGRRQNIRRRLLHANVERLAYAFYAIHVAFCITADNVFGERPMFSSSFHFHADFSRSRLNVYRLQNSKFTQLCTKLGRDITWILCFSAKH